MCSAGSSTNGPARKNTGLSQLARKGEPGINGGMMRPRPGQSAGTINTIGVPSLDQVIKKIEHQGGTICVPKMAIPGVGWLAYAEDLTGNVFGVLEPDTNAK
jgi:predicted enzyme related to lactoylglutathione lyase